MKNKKQYEVVEQDGKYLAAEVGNSEQTICIGADTREEAQKQVDKMNETYYLSDYTAEEINEFWESIDLTKVNKFLSELLGQQIKMEKHSRMERSGKIKYALIDGTNLVEKSLIIRAAWSEMYVQAFACDIGVDKETGSLYLWADIQLAYRHWDGGTNGASIGSVLYQDGKWQIKATSPSIK